MEIRRATEDDLPALGEIFVEAARRMAERHLPEAVGTFPPDPGRLLPMWRHLLATGACFVAEEPAPVGFATAVIRDGIWFLSQLWVLPARQGQGIGAALLDEALTWGRGSSAFSVVSSPDPAALSLYLRRSMYPMWTQYDLTGRPVIGTMEGALDPLTEEDDPWIGELDREARGIARPEDHRFFRARARGLVLRRDGGPSGYVYSWPSGRIGPAAVVDPSDIAPLLRGAVASLAGDAGATANLVVPSSNWSALAEAVRLGFRISGSSTFMASRRLGEASRYLSSGGALA